MSDDLHAQDFLNGALQEILKLINSSLNKLKKAKQQQQSLFPSLAEMEKEAKMVLDTLGLMSSLSYSEVLEQLKAKALTRANLTEEDVLEQIVLMDLGNETRSPCVQS